MTATARPDFYARITADIVAQLEAGVRPWHQPWNAAHAAGGISRPLRNTGQPYQGVNVLVLWLTAFQKGYACPIWLTFNQAKEAGGFVKKGEKGATVVYANSFEKTETDAQTGEETTERIPFLKAYTVFNAEQVDGLPGQYYALARPPQNLAERLDHAERFFAATRADTRHGGNKAFYSPSSDVIQLPPFESFESRETYYATRAHESVHWTKHETRLSRSFDSKRFGDDGYAVEELVAELGAAFLCADLGLTPQVMPEHAAYLDAWLKVLKADKRAIFTAASHASKAAEYLHGLQPEPASAADDPPRPPEATAAYERLAAAMDRHDFVTAREEAEALGRCIRDHGTYPAGHAKAAVDNFLTAAIVRSVYPD